MRMIQEKLPFNVVQARQQMLSFKHFCFALTSHLSLPFAEPQVNVLIPVKSFGFLSLLKRFCKHIVLILLWAS